MSIKGLLGATALVGVLAGFPIIAAAQTAPAAAPEPTADPAAPDVVVTGTRLRIPNAESIAPITSVTAQQIFDSGRVQVGDVLNDLPMLRSTLSSQNSLTGSLGLRGITALDLRGLGTIRTLTLVNGRREVAADIINNNPIVDINTLPTDLIDRVDIVTGGGSAVYGSDAIAGTVNFILKDHYSGLGIHGQTGVSKYGDAGDQYISIVAGQNFADGRGNIAFNAEYSHQSRYFASDRPEYSHNDAYVITQSDLTSAVNGSDGIFDRTFYQDIRSATISLGGQVGIRYSNAAAPCGTDANPTVGNRSSYTCAFIFQPDGSLVAQTGTRVGLGPNGNFLGGNGTSSREGELLTLTPELNRYAFNALGHFEISPAFTPFFEARFVRTKAFGSSSGPFFSQGQTLGDVDSLPTNATTGFSDFSYANNVVNNAGNPVFNAVNREGVRLDNPYLSASARATLAAQLIAAVNSGVNPNTGTAYTASTTGGTSGVAGTVAAAQAAAIAQINAGTFRFSNRRNWVDLGIRDENITRDTYKFVGGVRGDFNTDWHYEVSLNYGEHDETNVIQGNVNRQRYLLASDTARNGAGQIVCRAQIDPNYALTVSTATGTTAEKAAILAADIAACQPLNPFGEGSVSAAAKNYIQMNTLATGKATQVVVNGFITGDLSQLFELPGGPIGFSIGGEWRRETLRYDLDKTTQAGYAFYNAIPTFTAPAFEVKEAFGEINLPLVKDWFAIHDLTATGSGRIARYKGQTKNVTAWSAGLEYSPIQDIRFRGTYSKSVRSPYLGDLYSPQSQNFATVVDPCSSNNLASGTTFRPINCAAAGRPGGQAQGGTTYNYTYASSLEIRSGGNPNLIPEVSYSFTAGVVLQPRFIPGLSVSLDYYNIRVNKVITSVAAQTILNLCYDSPTLANVFCGLFQRAGASGGPRGEIEFRVLEGSLLQSAANFAKLQARGLDVNADYTHRFGFGTLGLRGVWTHVIQRDNFTNPSIPSFVNVITNELGDPQDTFNINANLKTGKLSFGYGFRWIGGMYLNTWEDYNASNGTNPQNADYAPIMKYPSVSYSDISASLEVNNRFTLNGGVNNVANKLPPYGLTGSGTGAIYDSRGRFFYVGFRAKL
ncbi:MAG: TonB-dependent receptor [Bradyrhizobium sp.]|nr:TonB-dependent receptor [Bradyrhizobium sp.]